MLRNRMMYIMTSADDVVSVPLDPGGERLCNYTIYLCHCCMSP